VPGNEGARKVGRRVLSDEEARGCGVKKLIHVRHVGSDLDPEDESELGRLGSDF